VTGCFDGDIAAKFLGAILSQPKVKRLLSTDHFSVDGTLIDAWASTKTFRPKGGSGEPPSDSGGRNEEADFHGAAVRPAGPPPTIRQSYVGSVIGDVGVERGLSHVLFNLFECRSWASEP
jgi:hypothetical protein